MLTLDPVSQVGTAPVDSGQIMICDVSFLEELSRTGQATCDLSDGVIVEVTPGPYTLFEKTDGGRITGVTAHNTAFNVDCIPVPSGRLIFIDPGYVIHDASQLPDNVDDLYSELCAVSLSDRRCGVALNGNVFVTSTGYGDGSYPVTNDPAILFDYTEVGECLRCHREINQQELDDYDEYCEPCWDKNNEEAEEEDEDDDF